MKYHCTIALSIILTCWTLKTQAQSLLPPNVPRFEITTTLPGPNLFPGHLFLDAFRSSPPFPDPASSMILDPQGDLLWYNPDNKLKVDFSMLPNGLLYWHQDDAYYLMDSTFTIVDSVFCANGKYLDKHELLLDDQGHYFVLCEEYTYEDLSTLNATTGAPGSTNGLVRYVAVQELDANQNLVREWDPVPHFSPQDITPSYFTNPNYMDLMHTNSLDLNAEGQVLLSNRSVSEITCIDWATGAIQWRLGGAQNQFNFGNDPGVSAQHDARFLDNGQISVFDNGKDHAIPVSRALVYALDTVNMTANPTWQYAHPAQLSSAMGNFQRLANGDALIGWGSAGANQVDHVTLIGADSVVKTRLFFVDQYKSYRARCMELPFQFDRPQISCTSGPNGIELSVLQNATSIKWSTGETTPSITVSDTGWYQVRIEKGIGWAVSKPFYLSDLNDPCAAVGINPELQAAPVLLGTWDVLGRPVSRPLQGQLYIRRYSDGSTEKIWEY